MAAVAENSDSDSSDDCAFLPYEIADGSILPYQFEPEVDVGVVEVTLESENVATASFSPRPGENDSVSVTVTGHSPMASRTQSTLGLHDPRRLGNTTWCRCGHCDILTLSVVKEHRCCREIPVVRTRIMNGQDKGKQS